jgi:hypothetical protein
LGDIIIIKAWTELPSRGSSAFGICNPFHLPIATILFPSNPIVAIFSMPRGQASHREHRNQSNPSCSHNTNPNPLGTQVQQDTQATANEFWERTPNDICKEIENVEDEVHLERSITHNWNINAKMGSWIPDEGSSRAQDTKYWKTMDLYWYIKMGVGKIMQDMDEAHVWRSCCSVMKFYYNLRTSTPGSMLQLNKLINLVLSPCRGNTSIIRMQMALL